jgi:hypothetical protein
VPAAKTELIFEQGALFDYAWVWLMPDRLTPRDLTGWAGHLQVRSESSPDPVVDLSTDNGGIIIDGKRGLFQLWMEPVDTALLTPEQFGKRAEFDLYLWVPGTPIRRRMLEGPAKLEVAVTR